MNSKTKGDISEAFIAATFLKQGKTVLRPIGDNARYDLVVDNSGSFERVQCKTAHYVDSSSGSMQFATVSSYNHTTNKRKRSYVGEVDYFAAYLPGENRVFLIPASEANGVGMNFRLKPTKNNQLTNCRNAVDYEIK